MFINLHHMEKYPKENVGKAMGQLIKLVRSNNEPFVTIELLSSY